MNGRLLLNTVESSAAGHHSPAVDTLQGAWAECAPRLCCREEKAQEKSRKKAERQAAGGGYVRHSVAAADMAAYGHAGRRGDYVGCQQLALVGLWACYWCNPCTWGVHRCKS